MIEFDYIRLGTLGLRDDDGAEGWGWLQLDDPHPRGKAPMTGEKDVTILVRDDDCLGLECRRASSIAEKTDGQERPNPAGEDVHLRCS